MAIEAEAPTGDRMLRVDALLKQKLGGIATSTLHKWMALGRFPRPVMLAGTIAVWPESEVDRWLAAQSRSKSLPRVNSCKASVLARARVAKKKKARTSRAAR